MRSVCSRIDALLHSLYSVSYGTADERAAQMNMPHQMHGGMPPGGPPGAPPYFNPGFEMMGPMAMRGRRGRGGRGMFMPPGYGGDPST